MRNSLCAIVPSLLFAACGTAQSAPSLPDPSPSILDEELAVTLESPDVTGALAVVLDARDGRVVAMQSLSGTARDPQLPAREGRSHGSVAKTFTFAIALDHGAISTSDHFDGAPTTVGGTEIRDREDHGSMSVEDALAFSSNVAAVHVLDQVGPTDLLSGLRALHFEVPASAENDAALAARLADGPALVATPLEIASAFAAVVNGGTYHAPWRQGEAPTTGERVLSEATSASMRTLLEAAVAREDGTGHRAAIAGTRVGGKTGTMTVDAGTHGAFVGAVPIDDPRFVIVVDVMASSSDYSGGTLAAPAFARIAERLLRD